MKISAAVKLFQGCKLALKNPARGVERAPKLRIFFEPEARKGFCCSHDGCITAIHMEHKDRSTPYIGAELIPPFHDWNPEKGVWKRKPTELGWWVYPLWYGNNGIWSTRSHTSLSLYQRIRVRNFDIQRFAKCVGVDDRDHKHSTNLHNIEMTRWHLVPFLGYPPNATPQENKP